MKPSTRDYYSDIVRRTVAFVASHLDEALDLEALAALAHVSPFHFHRIFKGMTGETPTELARRLRLERAAWQLRSGAAPVTEVAFDAGFETHEAFTRAFRASYDTSPTGFRERVHQRIELPSRSGVHFDPIASATPCVLSLEGVPFMDVTITAMPALRLATVRHVGPYNQIPVAFGALGRAVAPIAGELRQRGSSMIAIYYDDPESVPLEQLRSDAAVSLPDGLDAPEGTIERTLPAGRYGCALHVGPYAQLGDVWLRLLGQWLPASGERMAPAECYELYLNDPASTPQVELKTALYVPLV